MRRPTPRAFANATPCLVLWAALVSLTFSLPAYGAEPSDAGNAASSQATAANLSTGQQVIGATAIVCEDSSGVGFRSRIDTGAKTCSLHIEEVVIDNPDKNMRKNIGKPVRIRVRDLEGKSQWFETTIAETVKVKTSEEQERRYKVWLTLRYGEVKKRVHVTLNDRSHMEYPLLVGRNFLRGNFLVDVSRETKK